MHRCTVPGGVSDSAVREPAEKGPTLSERPGTGVDGSLGLDPERFPLLRGKVVDLSGRPIPAADVMETPEAFLVIADLPGVDDKSLRVSLDRNVLTIDATPLDEAPQGFKLQYAEYEVEEGNYHRTFLLPDEIDREGIEASVKDGILRLTLPKAVSAKVRKIPVKQG